MLVYPTLRLYWNGGSKANFAFSLLSFFLHFIYLFIYLLLIYKWENIYNKKKQVENELFTSVVVVRVIGSISCYVFWISWKSSLMITLVYWFLHNLNTFWNQDITIIYEGPNLGQGSNQFVAFFSLLLVYKCSFGAFSTSGMMIYNLLF